MLADAEPDELEESWGVEDCEELLVPNATSEMTDTSLSPESVTKTSRLAES